MPAARLCPARKARATSSRASDSCAANFFSRPARLKYSHTNGSVNMTSAVDRRQDRSAASPARSTVAPSAASSKPIAEQRARLDVAVGLLEQLLRAEELRRQRLQERLLVALERRLAQNVGLLRLLAAALADQQVERGGRLRPLRRGTRRPAARPRAATPTNTSARISIGVSVMGKPHGRRCSRSVSVVESCRQWPADRLTDLTAY